jgi:hypothetical protein
MFFVIPSEARNLSLIECREKRDFSARSAPRNDKSLSVSASRQAESGGNVEGHPE